MRWPKNVAWIRKGIWFLTQNKFNALEYLYEEGKKRDEWLKRATYRTVIDMHWWKFPFTISQWTRILSFFGHCAMDKILCCQVIQIRTFSQQTEVKKFWNLFSERKLNTRKVSIVFSSFDSNTFETNSHVILHIIH